MIETIGAIIGSIIALATIGYFLWDRYRPRPHKLEIDTKNILFARFGDPLHKQGNWGIAFYSMTVVNISRNPFTVKELRLRYKMDGENLSVISHVILTGSVYSPLEKTFVNAAIIRTGGQNIILMRWNNIRSEIGRHKTIEPGSVLSGSAYFILNFSDRAKLEQLKEVELALVDFLGKETTKIIKIERDWFEKSGDAVILNHEFTGDKNGNISFN
jgi:hypothetical protein